MLQYLFEEKNMPAVKFEHDLKLAAYSSGRSSGTFMLTGHGVTSCGVMVESKCVMLFANMLSIPY